MNSVIARRSSDEAIQCWQDVARGSGAHPPSRHWIATSQGLLAMTGLTYVLPYALCPLSPPPEGRCASGSTRGRGVAPAMDLAFRAKPNPGGLPRRGRAAGWVLGKRFQPQNRSLFPACVLTGRQYDWPGVKWPHKPLALPRREAQFGKRKDRRRHDGTSAAAVY